MVRYSEFEKILDSIPLSIIKKISKFVINENPSKMSMTKIMNQLELNSNEIIKVKKIFQDTTDGNLLSIALEQYLLSKEEKKISNYLVVSNSPKNSDIKLTHDVIYQMIHEAKKSIKIVGYWLYEFDLFFDELKQISEDLEKNIKIEIFIDNPSKWKSQIFKKWPLHNRPLIYGINEKLIKNKTLKTLHAKIILVDNSHCLITSANLTTNAMNENIEAGILTKDNFLIQEVRNMLKNYIDEEILVPF